MEHCCSKYAYVWRTDLERDIQGYSKCLWCGAEHDDKRGVPRNSVVVKGKVWSFTDAQRMLACYECHTNLRCLVRDRKLVLVCGGKVEHNIGETGRAITKKSRDWVEANATHEGQIVWDNLPEEYKEFIREQEKNHA